MSAGAASAPASAESDVELMRTILGEHVPQSVILTCLNACAFDVSAALNWYFAEVAASPTAAAAASAAVPQRPVAADAVPSIQSGLSLTLHPRAMEGMVSKSEAYYATLTRGDPAYDMLTPSNDKFLTIRLRKRGWRTGTFLGMPSPATQRPYFANGDVVTLECNGLWLKASSLNKMLQWKAPSEDDRNKFVIRGLPLGKNLAPGDYFFLTSYKWKDKEIVRKDERPVGISSYNTNVHRCFLGLERIKTCVFSSVLLTCEWVIVLTCALHCFFFDVAVGQGEPALVSVRQADPECTQESTETRRPDRCQPPDNQCHGHTHVDGQHQPSRAEPFGTWVFCLDQMQRTRADYSS